MSVGRKSVKLGGAPPSIPTPAAGPTLFSVVVANGPALAGSDAGHAPMAHPVAAPASPVVPVLVLPVVALVVPPVVRPVAPVAPVFPALVPVFPVLVPVA